MNPDPRAHRRPWPRRFVLWLVLGTSLIVVMGAAIIVDTVSVHHLSNRVQASIQTSRFDSAYRSCIGVDQRHKQAVHLLRHEPTDARAIAIPLIDALAPYYTNCVEYASSKTTLKTPSYLKPPPAKH